MKPAPFDYAAPSDLGELLALLADAGDEAAVIAGGQSLIPLMNLRLARPRLVLDLRRIESLSRYEIVDGALTAGSMARVLDVEDDASAGTVAGLTAALRHIGHRQIRVRTTFGGSIAHADPAAELPALLLALDGEVTLASAGGGDRSVAAADLFLGPFLTARQPDELVTEVRFPSYPGRLHVTEVAPRPGDFALVGCIAGYAADHGVVSSARVVVFGAGGRPQRLMAAEEALDGSPIDRPAIAAAAATVRADLVAFDDGHASASYRRSAAATIVERTLARATRELAA